MQRPQTGSVTGLFEEHSVGQCDPSILSEGERRVREKSGGPDHKGPCSLFLSFHSKGIREPLKGFEQR